MTNLTGVHTGNTRARDFVLDSECLGFGDFKHKWLVAVVVRPLLVVVVVASRYAIKITKAPKPVKGAVFATAEEGFEAAKKGQKRDAQQDLLSNVFLALFFCYPSFCEVCMASLQCTPDISPKSAGKQAEFTVLLVNDRVSCETTDHDTIQYLSMACIFLVGFGVPTACALFLKSQYAKEKAQDFNEETNILVADQLGLAGGASEAKYLVRDIQVGGYFVALTSP